MTDALATGRLSLAKMNIADAEFIMRLCNTPGWLKNIGDRNIHSVEGAAAYIEKILVTAFFNFWIVKIIANDTPVGIVTFLKKDYLPAPDIGFAFLPEHSGKGYAFEASKVVMDDAMRHNITAISAVTVTDNEPSIRLLGKLGFRPAGTIIEKDEELLLFLFP